VISVICVFNNREILESCLLKSLSKEENTFDLVLVDNTEKAFSSAASALNYGAQKAKGNFLAFVHQDVVFGEKFSLSELENQMDALPVGSIAGAAGRADEEGVMTCITHGDPPVQAGSIFVDGPEICQTLDEVFVVVPRETFDRIRFDERICTGWHLYAVDFCLSAINQSCLSFVVPVDLHHLSPGLSMDDSYYTILKRVAYKHKNSHSKIYTTMGIWPTSPYRLWMFITLRIIKRRVSKLLDRTEVGRNLHRACRGKKKSD
jgi:hypothetical protein